MTKKSDKPFFIETELGTVTQKGDWFNINEKQLEDFAPGLLKHISFATLIKEAQAWVQSASSLCLILLYVLLFFINPWVAAAISLAFYIFWYQNKSAFVLNKMADFFAIINSTAFLFIAALICLSFYAINNQFTAFAVGLIFFIVMKPGLPRKLWNRVSEQRGGNRLKLNDRVLKMIIIKHALYQPDSSPKELAKMEDRFTDIVANMKQKNKKQKKD